MLDQRQRVPVLIWSGFGMISLMLVFPFGWREPLPPVQAAWSRVEGAVSGASTTWRDDRSLLYFPVRYRAPDGAPKHSTIYSNKTQYQSANLKVRSRVLLDVEEIAGQFIVRRLITEQGEILYHPQLAEHVVLMNNRGVILGMVLFGILAIILFVSAGIIAYRIYRLGN